MRRAWQEWRVAWLGEPSGGGAQWEGALAPFDLALAGASEGERLRVEVRPERPASFPARDTSNHERT